MELLPDSLLFNPTFNISSGVLLVEYEGYHSITVTNVNGELTETVMDNIWLPTGQHQFTTTVTQQGLYFIHITDQRGNQITRKLLKL